MPPVESQTIAIRAATPADAPAIGRIHVESWRETYSELLPSDLLDSVAAVVRAAMWRGGLERERPIPLFVGHRADGDLVGFAAGGAARTTSLPHDAEVYAIYLLDEARGRGCGRRLMAALADALLARGFKSLCLWVREENAGARGFYQRLGGQLIGERTQADREHAFCEVAYGWTDLNLLCTGRAAEERR